MVRTAVSLVLLAFLLPAVVSAEPAGFSASKVCRVTSVPMDISGCGVSQSGAVSFVGCSASACTVAVDAGAATQGLPPGARTLSVTVNGDARTTLCASEAVAIDDAPLSCTGAAEVTVRVPTACRLFVVASTATADGGVVASASSEVRVCKDGSVAVV